MNWKFWQWQTRLERHVTKVMEELYELEAKVEQLKADNRRLRKMLELREARPIAREVAAQLGEQLVVVTEATPWWRHLHGLLQLEIDQAVNDALQPDLTNDTANLRRGRAAMLKDFRGLLQDIYLQAQTRKRESV